MLINSIPKLITDEIGIRWKCWSTAFQTKEYSYIALQNIHYKCKPLNKKNKLSSSSERKYMGSIIMKASGRGILIFDNLIKEFMSHLTVLQTVSMRTSFSIQLSSAAKVRWLLNQFSCLVRILRVGVNHHTVM